MASTKCNLAAPPSALLYRLEANESGIVRVVWEGVTSHTASSLLAAPTGSEERDALTEAIEFLRAALADGERTADDVTREARKSGISDRTLRRARREAGILKRREGFGPAGHWNWSLPLKADGQSE